MTKRTVYNLRLTNENMDWLFREADKLGISAAALTNVLIGSIREQQPDMLRLILGKLCKGTNIVSIPATTQQP